MSNKPIIRRRKSQRIDTENNKNITEAESTEKKIENSPNVFHAKPIKKHIEQKKSIKRSVSEIDLLKEIENFEMSSLITGQQYINVNVGDSVSGTITRLSKDTAFIDIGCKSEAIMLLENDHKTCVGDSITATVIQADSRGISIAQKINKHGDIETYQNAFEHCIPVSGTVSELNPGGFIIILGSTKAFCPKSQIDIYPTDFQQYINQVLDFEIIEIKTNELIVSRKRLLQKTRNKNKEKLLNSITIGSQHNGTVKNIKVFGTFIDIGGIDGFISQSTLTRFGVELSVGQEVLVTIDGIADDKITLSIPQYDPWFEIDKNYIPGKTYRGLITNRMEYGVFVKLCQGIQGLVHRSNLSHHPNQNPKTFSLDSDEVTVRILSIDHETKRLDLGIKQASYEEYQPNNATNAKTESTPKPTLGNTFADIFDQLDIK
jgi:small subunit ribosomal protein S1